MDIFIIIRTLFLKNQDSIYSYTFFNVFYAYFVAKEEQSFQLNFC